MEKCPMVSVLVLCYNYGHLLGKALEACAAQTFRDFEIVMINNGSTDDTEQVYQDFCRRHPEVQTTYVKVYPNKGILNGKKQGILHAKGEFVMLSDADDWMDPECLEKMIKTARETGADRVVAQYREVSPDGKLLRERAFPKPGRFGEHKLPFCMLQGVIFRRALLLEGNIEYPDVYTVGGEDYWFNFVCLLQEKKCAFVRQTLYNYYYNPKSVLVYQLAHSTSEEYLQRTLPGLELIGRVIKTGKGTLEQRSEMQYMFIKVCYIDIITAFQRYSYREAKRFYQQVHAVMLAYVPNYLHHPWLWPFNNGYEFSVAAVIYLLSLCERLHMVWPIRVAGLASRLSTNIR